MPDDGANQPDSTVNSGAPVNDGGVGAGAAAAGAGQVASGANSTAAGQEPAGGGAAAPAAPTALTSEEYADQIKALTEQNRRAVSYVSQLQSQQDQLQQQMAELRKTASAADAASFPKTPEQVVEMLKDPEGRFKPALQSLVRQQLAEQQGAVTAPGAVADPRFVVEVHERMSAAKEMAQFAREAGMSDPEVIGFMSEFGLQLNARGDIVQFPFSWAPDGKTAIKYAKDMIRGRVAPRMAAQTIQAAAAAGQVAADKQILGKLPATGGGTPAGAAGPGGADMDAFQKFLLQDISELTRVA